MICLSWNGGMSVGDEVNIYMVYLNDNIQSEELTLVKLLLRMILSLLVTIGGIHLWFTGIPVFLFIQETKITVIILGTVRLLVIHLNSRIDGLSHRMKLIGAPVNCWLDYSGIPPLIGSK